MTQMKNRELNKPVTTTSGIEVKDVYTPADVQATDYSRDIGFPGEYPFTRGIYRTMYRDKLWTMRQYAGLESPEESNERYKFLLSQGQTGLSVALDLPTQMGIDSDDELAEGEIGVVGVPIVSLRDMEALFDGIALDKVTVSFTINATAAIILAMYLAVAEKQDVPFEKVGGTIQNDILKEYVCRGAWILPVAPSVRLIGDTIEFCAHKAPKFNPISISGAHFRNAGANAIQELAFAFLDGMTYVDHMISRGMDIDTFAPRLSFWFATNLDIFEEVAKYRAARRIWARIMRDKYRAKRPESCRLRFGTATYGSSLTAEQPLNNIVRVAYETLAAVLGGTQAMFTQSYDEAYTIPGKESVQIALRTQQILAEETGITKTCDPLAGSYYVEYLVRRIEDEVLALMKKIETMGGMVRAIETGYIQNLVLDEAYDTEKKIRAREKIVVGQNKYRVDEDEQTIKLYKSNPETVKLQIERAKRHRADRDADRVAQVLQRVREGAAENINLMPLLVEAVKAYATVGEITGVLKEVFGSFQEPKMA